MSTVLWANRLRDGVVESDTRDKYALYRYSRKLDSVCKRSSGLSFAQLCDTTDLRVNLEDISLPDGMSSTDELMAREGVWQPAEEVVRMLAAALAEIREKKMRFGLLKNEYETVVAELEESLCYAEAAANEGAQFNFSVVM
ncbi:MAG: hypothetical protein REI12_11210 [Pedobacter sp.]|nr:hypothetical protein [Pedobacter sp.]